jgi:hypothetical protein
LFTDAKFPLGPIRIVRPFTSSRKSGGSVVTDPVGRNCFSFPEPDIAAWAFPSEAFMPIPNSQLMRKGFGQFQRLQAFGTA